MRVLYLNIVFLLEIIFTVHSLEVNYQSIMNSAMLSLNREHVKHTREAFKEEVMNNAETVSTVKAMYKLQQAAFRYRDDEEDFTDEDMQAFDDAVKFYNVSDVCLNHTKTTILALMAKEVWAVQVLDSFGKIPSGILNGNFIWLGSYDECRAVKGQQYGVNNPEEIFAGKFCGLGMSVAKHTLITAICIPDTCRDSEAKLIIDAGLSMILPKNKTFQFDVTCRETPDGFDGRAIGALVTSGILLFCLLVGTLYDILVLQDIQWQQKDEEREKTPLLKHTQSKTLPAEQGTFAKILLSFSVYTNGKKLLNTNQAKGSLTSVNGIRFLSMSWVILGHSFAFLIPYTENSLVFMPKLISRWTFQAVANALVSVDTFFTLSGLLLAYLFFKGMDKSHGKMNWGLFYFHRFWRLTPPYMLVLFLEVSLSRYFADGPMWSPENGFEQNFCKDTWWTNLLYVNNLVKDHKRCMGWSWYLANDMQFFVISPLLLLPLFYSAKIGIGICSLVLLGSWTATGVISTHYNLPATSFAKGVDQEIQNAYMTQYYVRPYTRIGPYIVGIVAGYILYRTEQGFSMKKIYNIIGWIVATGLACLVLYGLYDNASQRVTLSTGVASFYNTVHRSIWGACVCWVIFSCVRGYGGFVNTILSWKGFVPLSRLTYCAYLVHPLMIYTVYRSRRTLIYATDLTLIYFFLGNLVTSFMLAFVASLSLESPMMGLEKAILPTNRK